MNKSIWPYVSLVLSAIVTMCGIVLLLVGFIVYGISPSYSEVAQVDEESWQQLKETLTKLKSDEDVGPSKDDESVENPDRTEEERKQAVADQVTDGDPGALDDLPNSGFSVWCTDDEGNRVHKGNYIDMDSASEAAESDGGNCTAESGNQR